MLGMGDMDMGSSGLFRVGNLALARLYWYIIAGVLGLGLLLKGLGTLDVRRRLVFESGCPL